MTTPLNSSTPCPPLRNAACLIVGLGCLLTAGSVLSSVAKPVPRSAETALSACPFHPRSVYAIFCPPVGAPLGGHPVQALVCLQGGALQITNTSADCWHDIRLEAGRGRHWRFAKLGSYETCFVPLQNSRNSPPIRFAFEAPLPIEWHCRTPQGSGAWSGYVMP